jgi:hypothetical protein
MRVLIYPLLLLLLSLTGNIVISNKPSLFLIKRKREEIVLRMRKVSAKEQYILE